MKKNFLAVLAAAALPIIPAAALTVDDAEVVSSVDISSFTRGGNTEYGNAGFNGGDYSTSVFNGNFTDYKYMNGSGDTYLVVHLDKKLAGGYYVTNVKIGHAGNAKYSLYYTTDDDMTTATWTPICEQVQVAGIATYAVNAVATKVKYVFDTWVTWNQSLAEFQVWGVDPSQMECTHEAKYLSEWTAIPGSETCTEDGYESCVCSNCGTTLTRQSANVPKLGHSYVSELDAVGTGLQFGSGKITCARHDLEIDCTEGPVDLVPFGGVKVDGVVQFTDLSVSSTGNIDYGTHPRMMIDNNWTYAWNRFWYANSLQNEYADFEFGTAIDLTAVDISVHNHNHTVQFYSLADDGTETLVGEMAVVKNTDAEAEEYQRSTFEFRGVTLKTLRIRFANDDGGATQFGRSVMAICELHPYGTVQGAGKTAAVRTRVIIE